MPPPLAPAKGGTMIPLPLEPPSPGPTPTLLPSAEPPQAMAETQARSANDQGLKPLGRMECFMVGAHQNFTAISASGSPDRAIPMQSRRTLSYFRASFLLR